MAGLALGDIDVHSARQAWHLWHCTGSGGAWFPVDAVGAAAVCVAGVALGDIDLHFAWQVLHLATLTSICVAGMDGTCGIGLAVWHFVTHHL